MRFGLYYDFSFPGATSRFWGDVGEQLALADQLGFDSLWFSERHFADDAPGALHILLGFLATTTRAIRIGGFPVLPLANPVRIAEDWAVVDLQSNGRLNLGVARGEERSAFAACGRDWKTRESRFWETLDFVRHAWTSDEFQYLGRAVRFPSHLAARRRANPYERYVNPKRFIPQWERGAAVPDHLAVTPKPLQEPHPPLWVYGADAGLVRGAGSRGLSCVLPIESSRPRLVKEASAYSRALSRAGRHRAEGELGIVRDVVFETKPLPGQRRGSCLSGSPEKVVDALKRLQNDTGFNHFMWRVPYPALEQRKVLASLRRFAGEVQPMLQS